MKHDIDPAELLAFVGASGIGVQSKDVAAKFGVPPAAALHRLKQLPGIVRTHDKSTPLGRWCLPEQKKAAIAHIEAEFEARKEARRLKAIPKAKERWKRYLERLESGEVPIRRVVSAAKATPLVKLGPASVFEWGQR